MPLAQQGAGRISFLYCGIFETNSLSLHGCGLLKRHFSWPRASRNPSSCWRTCSYKLSRFARKFSLPAALPGQVRVNFLFRRVPRVVGRALDQEFFQQGGPEHTRVVQLPRQGRRGIREAVQKFGTVPQNSGRLVTLGTTPAPGCSADIVSGHASSHPRTRHLERGNGSAYCPS